MLWRLTRQLLLSRKGLFNGGIVHDSIIITYEFNMDGNSYSLDSITEEDTMTMENIEVRCSHNIGFHVMLWSIKEVMKE